MLALIPARGGSKGLPGKNIRPLHGKPMIAYSIEAAQACRSVTRVVVSTDCEEIAAVARQYGAEVPFMRPSSLAGDTSLAIDVYRYTIDRLAEESGNPIDEFVVLLPTCPMRKADDIDSAYQIFKDNQASSVVSYTEEEHPIFWHQYINEEGKFEAIFDEQRTGNRQADKTTYYPNGAIFMFTRAIIESGTYYNDNSYAYIMPGDRSVDVDTLADFEYIEYLMDK